MSAFGLTQLDDGRLELRLKRPWRDGTTAFRFTPHELIERLVSQVPRPRAHLARYHGVLAPAFAARSLVVAARGGDPPDNCPPPARPEAPPERPPRAARFPWASMIWRVFLKDALECARCAGRMEMVAAVTAPASIERILDHMGLPAMAPTVHRPRPPPQTELPFEEHSPDFEPDLPFRDDFES